MLMGCHKICAVLRRKGQADVPAVHHHHHHHHYQGDLVEDDGMDGRVMMSGDDVGGSREYGRVPTPPYCMCKKALSVRPLASMFSPTPPRTSSSFHPLGASCPARARGHG